MVQNVACGAFFGAETHSIKLGDGLGSAVLFAKGDQLYAEESDGCDVCGADRAGCLSSAGERRSIIR